MDDYESGSKDICSSTETGYDDTVHQLFGKNKDGSQANLPWNGLTSVDIIPPKASTVKSIPLWTYPSPNHDNVAVGMESTYYDNDPRIGILYNWMGATNCKYNPNGTDPFSFPSTTQEFTPALNPYKIQGICPNGWHLPSFPEVVDLLNEIRVNTSLYSSTADQSSYAAWDYKLADRDALAPPLKDFCSVQTGLALDKIAKVATSNPINSTQKPGLNVTFTGASDGKYMEAFKQMSYMWTSSVYSVDQAARFGVVADNKYVTLNGLPRTWYASVRCIQDFD